MRMIPSFLLLKDLKGLNKIHDQSPNIQTYMDQIPQIEEEIVSMHDKNKQQAANLKTEINKEFGDILKELEQCEKDIADLDKN